MYEVAGVLRRHVAGKAWLLALSALALAVALCPPGQARAAEVDELLGIARWLHGPPAVSVPVVRLPGDVGTPEQWAALYPAPQPGVLMAAG